MGILKAKSFASITAGFNKTLKELDALITEREVQQKAKYDTVHDLEKQINTVLDDAQALRAEQANAQRLKAKIENLIA